jgi:phosphopantetheinyl transferase
MPAVKQINTGDYQVLVWKIEEDLDFFARAISLSFNESQDFVNISNTYRKLEWLASRYVQRQLVEDSLFKDEFGKPNLEQQDGFISIAHCKDYAAAIYSRTLAVGIDIEPIHDKVLRISGKFLSPQELDFIDACETTKHVISAWSIKEAIYKWYGKKELSFKNNIKIRAFQVSDTTVKVDFDKDDFKITKKVMLLNVEQCMLAFTF